MNCLIVDDDKMARMALRKLVEEVGGLEIKGEFSGALEAAGYLEKEPVDLIFLDIEMPGMSGIDLIRNLERRPIIILITARDNYAVEAFELNVADYVVKPVSLSRLLTAVNKARELYESRSKKLELAEKEKEYIFVRSKSALTKIKIDDITYIQALGDYINIFTSSSRSTVHITLKGIEERLSPGKFYRIHRSYLIAVNHIDKVEEGTAFIGKHPIPIGEQYKKDLLRNLNLI
jgi:two-component system LytT family response regulator